MYRNTNTDLQTNQSILKCEGWQRDNCIHLYITRTEEMLVWYNLASYPILLSSLVLSGARAKVANTLVYFLRGRNKSKVILIYQWLTLRHLSNPTPNLFSKMNSKWGMPGHLSCCSTLSETSTVNWTWVQFTLEFCILGQNHYN